MTLNEHVLCLSAGKRWSRMHHAGAFLHFWYLPVGGVSITAFVSNCVCTLNNWLIFDFSPLFSPSVMILALVGAFPSSLLGVLACRVTISPNWREFCLQHARSQIYLWTLWRKSCHLRTFGIMSMFIRSPAMQLRTASGETTQAAGQSSDHCSFLSSSIACFVSLILQQVHQCNGSTFCQLRHKHEKEDVAWGERAEASLNY